MARYLAQVSAPDDGSIPQNVMVNTWAFESNSGSPTTGELDTISTALFLFYEQLEGYIGSTVAPDWGLKIYNIDDAEPRTPLRETSEFGPFTMTASPLPAEVACCLSFHGIFVSGQPKARRRGRVYIGPMGTNGVSTSVDGYARPSSDVKDAFSAALDAFLGELDGSGVLHSVWSRADDELYNVIEYSTDNAYDTQRRRGPAPTIRWVIPEP